jgi:tRNA(Arg) A34 adenosine deaminase TadA
MNLAIDAARNVPRRPFGAVIVDSNSGESVCRGWNRSDTNPVLHGEIDALNRLHEAPARDPSSLVLYSTAEPCVMCLGAILWSGINTIVFGTSVETLIRLGFKQFRISAEELIEKSFNTQCELIGGILERECDQLFADGDKLQAS